MVNLLKLWRSFLILVMKQELELVQLIGVGRIRNDWSRFMNSIFFLTSQGLLIQAKSRLHSFVYVKLCCMGLRLGQEEYNVVTL